MCKLGSALRTLSTENTECVGRKMLKKSVTRRKTSPAADRCETRTQKRNRMRKKKTKAFRSLWRRLPTSVHQQRVADLHGGQQEPRQRRHQARPEADGHAEGAQRRDEEQHRLHQQRPRDHVQRRPLCVPEATEMDRAREDAVVRVVRRQVSSAIDDVGCID